MIIATNFNKKFSAPHTLIEKIKQTAKSFNASCKKINNCILAINKKIGPHDIYDYETISEALKLMEYTPRKKR